ncbi:hypothetical protein Tco_0626588 [Tanacetum coccineum]|uniref:Uncharacterized protein n=1 Tax=Tanacetum coccineum TaxID=301880 RepID=A0ABQ4WK25_9ASTR
MTARITIPEPVPVPAWSDSEVARLLAISSPHDTPWSQHHPDSFSATPPPIPSPSLPLSPPSPVLSAPPPSPIRSLGYRAAMIRMRAEAAATSHSYHTPTPSYSPPTKPMPHHPGPQSAPTSLPPCYYPLEIRRDPERYVGYGITDSWDEIVETYREAPVIPDKELETAIGRGRVNMLFRDRRAHAHTRHLMETEARMSREAWGRSMDASDLARAEVMSLRTTVHAQMSEITELQSADRSRRKKRAISDLLKTDRGRREEMRELRAADRTQQQQIIQTLTVMQTL